MRPCRRGPIVTSQERRRPARWVVIGLGVYAVAIVAVLLLPIGYSQIVHEIGDAVRSALGISFGDGWIELGANIVMFVPLGFLLTVLLRRHWHGVMLALALSVAAELAQLVIPSRQPSLRDVAANLLGALIGAALAWWLVVRRERARSAGSWLPHSLDGTGEGVPTRAEPGTPEEDAPH